MENEQDEKHASSLKIWRKVADIVWNVCLNGVICFVVYLLEACVFVLTLIGIPFIKSYFRYAKNMFHPAGYKMVNNRKVGGFMFFLTIVYDIFYGWEEFLFTLLLGLLCYASIIYIPIGKQLWHHAKFFLNPRAYTFERISYQGVSDEEEEEIEKAPKEELNEKTAPKTEKEPAPVKAAPEVKAPAKEEPVKSAPEEKKVEKSEKAKDSNKTPIVAQYFNYTNEPPKGPYADWANKRW